MIITRQLLSTWGACSDYQGSALNRIAGNRQEMTIREVISLPIPHNDKMWLLTHALWHRDPWLCYDFALWCAEQAIEYVEPDWKARATATLDGVRGLRGQSAWAASASAYTSACTSASAASAYASASVVLAASAAADAAWAAAAAAYDAAAGAAAYASASAASAADAAADAAGAAGAAGAAQIDKALAMLEAP